MYIIEKDICVDTYIAFLERLASLLVLVTKVLLGSFCKEVTNVEKDEGIQNISLLKSLEFWLGKRAALQMSFQRV